MNEAVGVVGGHRGRLVELITRFATYGPGVLLRCFLGEVRLHVTVVVVGAAEVVDVDASEPITVAALFVLSLCTATELR